MKYPLAHLLPYLSRYRLRLIIGFVMVVLTVVAGMFSPWVLKYVVDDLQSGIVLKHLTFYAGIIVGISFIEGFFRFWMRKILIGMSREVEYDLRNDFFAHVERMSLSFFQSRSTGDIMARATNDLNAVRFVLGPGIMYSMHTIVLTIIATYKLLSMSWELTLLAYIPLVLASVSAKSFGRRIHDRFQTIQEQFAALSTQIQENLAGIRVVKSYAREDSEVEAFKKLNREYVARNIPLIRLWGLFFPLVAVFSGLSTVAVLWFGGKLIIEGRLTLGDFVAFLGYLMMLRWPTMAIGRVINIFERGSASMGRILQVMRTPPQIASDPQAAPVEEPRGEISIRNLTFRYPGAQKPALQDVDITVPPGTTLAIVGHTGSGKSSLVNLIPRLYDPPPGTILVDGKDVRDWPLSQLRQSIGYVPQETFLFSDTIRENIAFGRSGEMPEPELDWAARASQIAVDIESFAHKMDTYVGERGITLSGGQKQRIAISRALSVYPQILIFDDSLSNVDTYTEERILEELFKVMEDRTTILVSHRVSTVKNAHQIVVLKEGTVAEKGTHDSLMERDGVYAALYRKQLLEEELKTS